MAVRTRQDLFGCNSRLDTTQIVTCSKLVSGITGFPVQPNKAVVGANAFAHESGIHQDGVLKSRETYEIMRAQDVGWTENRMVLGKHSGRNAFRARLEELGIDFESEEDLTRFFGLLTAATSGIALVSQLFITNRVIRRFGIRSIKYEAGKGFSLNGKVRKFKGVCLHHDLGPLGAAVNISAMRRQLRILKDLGCD